MNALIRKFDVSMIKQTDSLQLTEIQNNFVDIKQKITETQEFISQKKVEYTEKLEKSEGDLQKDIQTTAGQINSGVLVLDYIAGEIPSIQVAMKDVA